MQRLRKFLKKILKNWDLSLIVLGMVLTAFINKYYFRLSLIFTFTYMGLLAALLLAISLKKWGREIQATRPCNYCGGSGFERWYFDIQVKRGSQKSTMRVEKQLGYYPCTYCNEPDYQTIKNEIERITKIKEYLDK